MTGPNQPTSFDDTSSSFDDISSSFDKLPRISQYDEADILVFQWTTSLPEVLVYYDQLGAIWKLKFQQISAIENSYSKS